MLEVPECPSCGEGMVWTFAFPGKEWACLPCNQHEPMFNGLPKIQVAEEQIDHKKESWSRDLHVIALRYGGGRCISEREFDSQPCPQGLCPIEDDYQFEY